MATGRPTGRPPKDAEARSPLRGRGKVRTIAAAPAATAHQQLTDSLEPDTFGIAAAASDAPWLRLADKPAIRLAQLIGIELAGQVRAGQPDEVGTAPMFPPVENRTIRELGPMLVGLLSDLGMTPQARARLNIQLAEEPEEAPTAMVPTRIPKAMR